MGDSADTVEGRRFGQYEVVTRVGSSGGATIYRGRQTNLGRSVTITVLPAAAAEKPAYRLRFERQMEAASKLRHENILSAIDAGELDGDRYIVAEHVGGRRLGEMLEAGEWIGIRRCIGVTLGIARALAHLEDVGLLHRNLTPRSIILAESGAPKLRGFSFSRPRRDASSETWFDPEVFSAHYKAPDIIDHKQLDVRADIYSLGCVLFHMLTGRPPFPSRNAAVALERHAKEPLPDAAAQREDMPRDLGHVLAKALVKDRERRYATAAALVADLEAVEAGRAVEPPREGRRPLFRRRRSR